MTEGSSGRPLAVVLLSGGMDSCVAVSIAARAHALALLHVGYGQRTEQRELRSFREIARHVGAPLCLEARAGHLGIIGGSALTDPRRDAIDARRTGSSVPDTYVPFRNTHLLAIGVSWAEVIDARRIYIGAVEEDGSGYPDCREEYYEAFNHLIRLGTRPETDLDIVTPVIHMTKSDIVREGVRLEAPFHLTWSCYVDSDLACGECDSSSLRTRGFRGAGVEDPIVYKKYPVEL